MKNSLFIKLFKILRKLLLKGISKRAIKINSKGQVTKYFDKFIENKIIYYLRKNLKIKAEIVSEELNKNIMIKKNNKGEKFYIIIDPVDGSDNYLFNIPFVCLGIAVFNEKKESVFSFVGNYYTGEYILADNKKINFHLNNKSKMKKGGAFFIISHIDSKHINQLKNIVKKFNNIRAIGATVGEMMLVASGFMDCFIDVRKRLTLENFAPFFLIAKHTNSILTDMKGNEIKLKTFSLTKKYRIIFSKNMQIHNKVIKLVNQKIG